MTTATASADRRGWYWPAIVVALLLAPVVMNGIVLARVTSDPTFAIEKDYYKKAITWDAHMAQAQANTALGWRATAQAARVAGQGAQIVVAVQDRAGRPVTGATVRVEAFANARSAQRVEAALAPFANGYSAVLPLASTGLHELRLRVERGGEVFTSVVRVEVR